MWCTRTMSSSSLGNDTFLTALPFLARFSLNYCFLVSFSTLRSFFLFSVLPLIWLFFDESILSVKLEASSFYDLFSTSSTVYDISISTGYELYWELIPAIASNCEQLDSSSVYASCTYRLLRSRGGDILTGDGWTYDGLSSPPDRSMIFFGSIPFMSIPRSIELTSSIFLFLLTIFYKDSRTSFSPSESPFSLFFRFFLSINLSARAFSLTLSIILDVLFCYWFYLRNPIILFWAVNFLSTFFFRF